MLVWIYNNIRGSTMEKEKVGYIYILTNEAFHKSNWVKIGYTENLEQRLRSLYNTSVPTPFEIYATYEVPESAGIADKSLHLLIQKLNPELRLTENREFFEIEPWDAYDILEAMAKIHGRTDKLFQNKKNKYFNNPEVINQPGDYSKESLFPDGSYVSRLYETIKNLVLSMYPDLKITTLKNYIGFKKGKKHNVISVWPKENSLEIVLNAKRGLINDPEELTYDISNRMWTAAQYAFRFDEQSNINYIKTLIEQTYVQVK